MSQTITITLTDTEYKCMEYVAYNVTDWAENATKVRAEKAKEVIIALLVKHCNENDIQIATGEAAQVTQAYTLGVVDTAANTQPDAPVV